MKWKKPQHRDKRFKGGFILFPKTIGNETRWLEHAYWSECYLPNCNEGFSKFSWFAQEWITFTDYYTQGKGIDVLAKEMYEIGKK